MIQDYTAAELQRNGSRPNFKETGTSGLDAWSGYIYEAYNTELYWPDVYTLYNRLRRSDPEITIIRHLYAAMANDVAFEWELPDDATPADEALNEFLNSLFHDLQGGQRRFIDSIVSYVPFMGWGWWEAVPGLRKDGWRNPDQWESNYNDGLIGFRKFAWRDHSSFNRWIMDDATGIMSGMEQQDYPNPPVVIPLDRSIHLTFGDRDNPEGLTPLEAVWRLERIKYGLEVVQGIGYEHSAGHLKIKAFEELDASAKAIIKQAARAVLTAQEGNYFTEIDGKFEGTIMDVNFAAAPAILEAIRYYGLLKLQVYNMQWVSIAATAGGGAYSAMQDSSTMMLAMWNAMMSGFAEQAGEQLWQQTRRYNPELFNGISGKQKLLATPIEKEIPLGEMAQLLPVLFQTLPLDDEDFIAIRRKLGFLPETLPEVEDIEEPVEEVEDIGETEEMPEEEIAEEENLSLFERFKGLFVAKSKRVELAAAVSNAADDYGDKLAELIEQAMDGELTRDEFIEKARAIVAIELEQAFRKGAKLNADDTLFPPERQAINNELKLHEFSIQQLADELYEAINGPTN